MNGKIYRVYIFVGIFLLVAFLFVLWMFNKSKKISDENIVIKKEAVEVQKETNQLLKELIEQLKKKR